MKIFWTLPNFHASSDFRLEGSVLLSNYGDIEKYSILQGIEIIQAISIIRYFS